MGRLTTHVLDTASGKPASGVCGELYEFGPDVSLITDFVTNADGRVDKPLLSGDQFRPGTYELVFHIADYFGLPEDGSHFLGDVVIRFNLSKDEPYHVPLLVSPWSYTTYRGS